MAANIKWIDILTEWSYQGVQKDSATGMRRRELEARGNLFQSFAIANDCHFIGTNNGSILYILRRCKNPTVFSGHKGAVTALVYSSSETSFNLLFSGSVDRTIRVWDPERSGDPCIQAITGHGGTICAIGHSEGVLVSSSTDCTVRIWREQEGRALLKYPYFVCTQSFSFADVWVESIAIHFGQMSRLFFGCSNGDLLIYECQKNVFVPFVSHYRAHTLGILKLLLVHEENILLCLSRDQSVSIYYETNGSLMGDFSNSRRSYYTSASWDYFNHEVFLVDNLGYFEIWDVFLKKLRKVDSLMSTSIVDMKLRDRTPYFTLITKDKCYEFKVMRNLEYALYSGHEDSVLAVRLIDPENGMIAEQARLYSVGRDSHILVWDPYDMSILMNYKDTETEISCMDFLRESGLIVIGGEDGSMKWWNPELGTFIVCRDHKNLICAIDHTDLTREDIVASGDYDGCIGIWYCVKKKTMKPNLDNIYHLLEGEDCEILSLKWIRGKYENEEFSAIAFSGNQSDIKIWEPQGKILCSTLKGHEFPVSAMCSYSNMLFSGDEGGFIFLWNTRLLDKSYLLHRFSCHEGKVTQILVVDKTMILSSSHDRTIKFWDYGGKSGWSEDYHLKELHCVTHKYKFNDVSEDSTILFTATEEGMMVSIPVANTLLVAATPSAPSLRVSRESEKIASSEGAQPLVAAAARESSAESKTAPADL